MTTFAIKKKELETKQEELNKAYSDARDENGWKTITPEQQKEFIDRNNELKTLTEEVLRIEKLDEAYEKNQEALKAATQYGRREHVSSVFGGGADGAEDSVKTERMKHDGTKSLGDAFVSSKPYVNRKDNGGSRFGVDLTGISVKKILYASDMQSVEDNPAVKTTMTTSAGVAAYPPRMAEFVPFALREPVVADLMPNQDTDAPSIIYIEITTFTNNAAATAEAASKPESALAGTQRTVAMSKISTVLPVSEEQMDDVQGIRELIDNGLTSMVRLEEDRELLAGSGSSSEMTGFYNKSGVNTAAFSGNRFAAALTAMKSVRTIGFSVPDGWVVHPTDWYTFSIEQDALGRFILGDPGQATPKVLWGLPVVETMGATAGTLLTGAFRTWAKVYRKMDLRIDAGYVNDDFRKNLMTIRAEERACLVVFRPAAFSLVTSF